MIFFDINEANIAAYKKELEKLDLDIQCVNTNVTELEATVFVSPANSRGFMRGGIDGVYARMFPDVESKVQKMIGECGLKQKERFYIPVGSAIIVPVSKQQDEEQEPAYKLMCAPTMENPGSSLQGTDSVYWAMLGVLKCIETNPKQEVVAIPCLGTGVGGLTPEESALQVSRALQDHNNNRRPAADIFCDTPGRYVATKAIEDSLDLTEDFETLDISDTPPTPPQTCLFPNIFC